MKPRHKRLAIIVGGLSVLGIAAALVLNAFNSNLVFFFTPTQIVAGEAPRDRTFRIGGLVKVGTLSRVDTTAHFVVTDNAKEIPVAYTGILPDLFREGQGVIAEGKIDPASGTFHAETILAKHDEKYMPPEVAKALKDGKAQKMAQP